MNYRIVVIAVIACALSACSHGAWQEGITENVAATPASTVINRAALTNAVWGVGTDIPADVACVAGSQFIFDATRNAFTLVPNAQADPLFITPALIVASLTIDMPEKDVGLRADSCPVGNLTYLVSVSPEAPLDIESASEGCPKLEDVASSELGAFPVSGTVTAHFAAEEVKNTSACAEGDEACIAAAPVTQMLKLVIDECTAASTTVTPL